MDRAELLGYVRELRARQRESDKQLGFNYFGLQL